MTGLLFAYGSVPPGTTHDHAIGQADPSILSKRDVLARLLDLDPSLDFEFQSSIRNEVREIDIDTPDAYQKLTAIEEMLAEHPAYGEANLLSSLRWDINLLAMRANAYE